MESYRSRRIYREHLWSLPKKDGLLRFSADYRKLNALTSHDAYSMPRVDEVLDHLGGANYLTSGLGEGVLADSHGRKCLGTDSFHHTFEFYQFEVMLWVAPSGGAVGFLCRNTQHGSV